MNEMRWPKGLKVIMDNFVDQLRKIYQDNCVSIVLYGSAASGEFLDRYSDVNVLVILKDAGLGELKKVFSVVNNRKFRLVKPLFLTQEYIKTSLDVFPVEFLDMKENYLLLFGKDVLAGLEIDLKNLRFQCEQELKSKLLMINQNYLRVKDALLLKTLLLKSFSSVLHILRNLIRLKGGKPAYLKEDIIKQAGAYFKIDAVCFNNILALKSDKSAQLNYVTLEKLLIDFTDEIRSLTVQIEHL